MQLDLLVEEPSMKVALGYLLPKLVQNRARYNILDLRSKSNLLKVLPQRLAAYRQRIQRGEHLRVMVLVDCDRDPCESLKSKLEALARQAGLATKSSPDAQGRFWVVTRIASEELESWFLGDPIALRQAFGSLPKIDPKKKPFCNPDPSGTWETLHRFLKQHGIYPSHYPKIEAAHRIAPHLDVARNRSPSFQQFAAGLEAVLRNP